MTPVERTGRDDGLQRERTTLAWRRTGLSLVVAAVVIARLSANELGATAAVLGAAAAAGSAWVVLATMRRGGFYARPVGESADSAFSWVLNDGRAPAALAAVICLMSTLELAAIVLT